MMKILIENLEFYAIIGILPKERVNPQKIVMDFEIFYEYKKDSFIDYSLVVKTAKNFIIKSKFEIIEDALVNLSEILKDNFPQIKKIKILLKKPQILPECSVGVEYSKKF